MEVSEQRAQAVIDYWVRKGIDPSRLIADARGETEASEDDDEETAALHRRAEFVIEGLLG
jgi:outer membrane protein OmpA-like peptidoglycan-associated protein